MKLERACPVCGGDLFGSPRKGYYCPRCDRLFWNRSLALRHIRQDTRKLIDEHFGEHAAAAVNADLLELRRAVQDIASLLERDIVPSELEEARRSFEEWKASRVLGKTQKPPSMKQRVTRKPAKKVKRGAKVRKRSARR